MQTKHSMALLGLLTLLLCELMTVVNSNRTEALRIMNGTPVIDGHNDLPWQLLSTFNNQLNKVDLFTLTGTHTNIPKLQEGRVGGQFWAAFVPCDTQGKDAVKRTLEQIDVIHRMCKKYPTEFLCVESAEGIAEAIRNKKVASLIGVEGGHSIDSSLGVLRTFYHLGVRYMTLTHSCNVPWDLLAGPLLPTPLKGCTWREHIPVADTIFVLYSDVLRLLSFLDPSHWVDNWLVDTGSHSPKSNGLSEFGKKVILEMNRLGMIVDLAHVSEKTMRDTLEVSQAPVIFSHSSAFTLCKSARNVNDDVLQIVKEKKGLVMVNFYNNYVTCNNSASLSDVADHFDHIKRIAGYESVGFGGDYDGVPRVPNGLEDVSKYPDLVAELLKRGWTQTELEAALAKNLLRVFKEVEQIRIKMLSVKPIDDPIDYEEIQSDCHTSYGYNIATRTAVHPQGFLLMCLFYTLFL